MPMLDDARLALHNRVMKLIEENPEISQRELARELGLSLGKFNHFLKRFVKFDNFRRIEAE
ncbi:winged helix-turn-helix transcriptional regulator [Candidatus Parcubacteria bacterium]|nr:MAG: winged helix-turn-helix transcriptional regulator [Candidatus Parcubacteria bacterium]